MLRIISALVILVFFTIYCASGIVAGARLFESTFGMSYETALWAGAAATILYTFVGGFLAVSWTDTVQASLMIFALILTPVIVIFAVGGVEPTFAGSDQAEEHRKRRHAEGRLNFVGDDLPDGLGPGLLRPAAHSGALYGGRFAPHHRACAPHQHDLDDPLPGGRRRRGLLRHRLLPGAPGAGCGAVSENAERVFIELAKILFNPWIAGMLLSAILAAVMSTLSCQLLVCSRALTEDLYKAFLRKGASQKELVWVGRFMVLLVALVAICAGGQPGKPRAGPGELRLGRLRRRLWSGGAVLRDVEAHDPQRRAGRDDYRCGDGDRLEAVRLAGPVRNHPGLPLRQHRHCGVQPGRPRTVG